jgi:hypothetical protein
MKLCPIRWLGIMLVGSCPSPESVLVSPAVANLTVGEPELSGHGQKWTNPARRGAEWTASQPG